ncbi:MAG: hypothetical protein KAJ81_06315, partial [Candidatus Latescibacteria bacterium]|nr:hypothetical protein [Candidatus Latescibacterota bacterium]
LEALGLTVYFHQLIHKEQAVRLFSGELSQADYLVLCADGVPEDEGGPGIRIECLDRTADEKNKWEKINFDLNRETVPNILKYPFDTILSIACSSGDPVIAEAFLSSGTRTYIGPVKPADVTSSCMFVLTYFFHRISYGERSPKNHEEAIERAVNFEEDRPGSTRLFKSYAR